MLVAPDRGNGQTAGAGAGAGERVDHDLMMTAKVIRRAYDVALEQRLGLTLHEANVLAELSAARSLTQVELARRVGVSRARVGVHIDALADKDAVVRVADPADRRVWQVSLTRRGRSLWKQVIAVNRTVGTRVHAGLTDEQLDVLGRLLLALRDNVHVEVENAG